jgi:DNA-binding response OmpR family regulator
MPIEPILNVEARELVYGDIHIGLTPLEFNLIQYLNEHEGKAVSRDDLLNTVWGYEYDGGSNVVDRMVRSLRKKMGDQSKCIETVAGIGYRLRWAS